MESCFETGVLPPIVSSQTRQGAALSLSVMLWIAFFMAQYWV